MATDFNGHNHHAGDPGEGDDTNHFVNGYGSDGSDDGLSDASSEVTELGSDDFPASFEERDGRLFHSHGGLPYPLPVDTSEQEVGTIIPPSRSRIAVVVQGVWRSAHN
jgi:hypothetical protein